MKLTLKDTLRAFRASLDPQEWRWLCEQALRRYKPTDEEFERVTRFERDYEAQLRGYHALGLLDAPLCINWDRTTPFAEFADGLLELLDYTDGYGRTVRSTADEWLDQP